MNVVSTLEALTIALLEKEVIAQLIDRIYCAVAKYVAVVDVSQR